MADKCRDLQCEQASWRPEKADGGTQRKSWPAPEPGRADVSVAAQRQEKAGAPLEHYRAGFTLTLERGILFVLLRPSTGWKACAEQDESPPRKEGQSALLKSIAVKH